MSMVSDQVEADTHLRILIAAEKLFREIGYQKTTVADIAKSLHMSPANVYRFFDSKRAIYEGVAVRLMTEVETAARKIASGPDAPAKRLPALLSAIHHINVSLFIGDAKLHEMVMMAMEQNWDACERHIENMTAIIGDVIADGAASGDFRVMDVATAAQCTCTAMLRFFHPYNIKECADKLQPTLEQMIGFVMNALGASLAPAKRG